MKLYLHSTSGERVMGWAGEKNTEVVSNGGSETAINKQLEIRDTWRHTKHLEVTRRMVAVLLRLTPRSRVLLVTLTVPQLVRKPVPVYIIRTFIAIVTKSRNLSLSWAKLTQSTSNYRFYRLILSYHLCLGLPSGVFPSDFPTKILCAYIFSQIRAICPPCFILLHFITPIMLCEEYKSRATPHYTIFSTLYFQSLRCN